MLFVTSCTKTSIEPSPTTYISEDTVANRTGTVEVDVSVTGFEIIIDDGTLEFTGFDTDLNGLSIAPVQYVDFTDETGETVSVQVSVTDFEIIIDDGTLEFTIQSVDFSSLDIATEQSLIFIE